MGTELKSQMPRRRKQANPWKNKKKQKTKQKNKKQKTKTKQNKIATGYSWIEPKPHKKMNSLERKLL